jgi:hypothetical protein
LSKLEAVTCVKEWRYVSSVLKLGTIRNGLFDSTVQKDPLLLGETQFRSSIPGKERCLMILSGLETCSLSVQSTV